MSGPAAGIRSVSTGRRCPAIRNATPSSSCSASYPSSRTGAAIRAGCRSSGAVAAAAAVGRATRAVARQSAGSPVRARASSQIRSPSAVTGIASRSIARPSLTAVSRDRCGRSSCHRPAPTTVSGFGADAAARTSRGAPPSAGSNTAWTWACTAVACSCTSIPSGSRRPVAVSAAGAPVAPGSVRSRALDQRSAHRRTGIRSRVAPGQDAASSAANPSSSVACRRSAGSGSIAETTGAAPPTSSWSMPCQPARARSLSQLRAAARRFAAWSTPPAPAGAASSATGRPTASVTRAVSASCTEPSRAARAAASATKWSSPAAPATVLSAASATRAASGVPATASASSTTPAAWPGCGRSRPATSAASKASTAARASSRPSTGSNSRSARIRPPPSSSGTTASRAAARCPERVPGTPGAAGTG
ncbi:hypothetical protein SHIRM173S_03737 [Streptomyces hirsutus]